MRTQIRFANGHLNRLRSKLLKDLDNEYFAVLYAKTHLLANGDRIMVVKDSVLPDRSAYQEQSTSTLSISNDFLAYCLHTIDERLDVDSIIHVHTHPFDQGQPRFSSIDNQDEQNLRKYLDKVAKDINFASIVLSQTSYAARFWEVGKENPNSVHAKLKTQKVTENLETETDFKNETSRIQEIIQNRSMLALGQKTLRHMMNNQTITVVGVGGIGSIIAEHLVHMGFQSLCLIDPDEIELSNLNRLVGATYADAKNNTPKVFALKRHLKSINPHVKIEACAKSIFDVEIEDYVANADWLILTTDNYSSAVKVQDLAFKYYVPFISAATNMVVINNELKDVRGEVILIRIGDGICLNCLNKIDKTALIYETHPNQAVKEQMVQKGYVSGHEVKDPAVKTLNATLATLAVDVLINQFTERQSDYPVLTYENNVLPSLYPDQKSVKQKKQACHICREGLM